jgi:ATP-dependent helicase HrpB
MPPLPIDDALPEIGATLRTQPRVLVEAPPGSGKTTRIPPFLVDGDVIEGDVVVVEPRRIAARFAARHVSSERGEPLGATIGYQVRFESVVSPATRVRYVTEGVFARQLLSDPTLRGVGAVVLDEFHERHLHADLALGWLLHLQNTTRPDLRLVVMSATLEASPLEAFLSPCGRIRAEGQRFEVAVTFSNTPDDRPLPLRVASAIRTMTRDGLDGNVLVFLPGAAEIRKAAEACEAVARSAGLEVVTLHGNLPSEEQDRALAPSAKPKVILSTNVAESSVTIDGVVAVIDSGLARIAGHAPWSGLPTLQVAPVSKASVTQRTGRAGRTRPGRCLRLFSEADWMRRPDHDPPEVRRSDLTEAALMVRGLGGTDVHAFPWLDPPEPAAWAAADALLSDLGALRPDGSLSAIGQKLLRFPTHPRVARILVEAERRGVVPDAATVAALIGERDIALRRRSTVTGATGDKGSADILDSLDLFRKAASDRFSDRALHALGVDPRAAREVDKVRRSLLACARSAAPSPSSAENALRTCVLAGYPDRVARKVRGREVALAGGGLAVVDADEWSVPEFLVAVDAEERREGKTRRLMVRSLCALDPASVLDLFPDRVEENEEHRWNAGRGCVETVERLTYRGLTLDETRNPKSVSREASAVLASEAMAQGVHTFAPEGELDSLLGRVAFLRDQGHDVPAMDVAFAQAKLRELCEGKRCLREVHDEGLIEALRACFSHTQVQRLERFAPRSVRLPGGRELRIHYEPGKPPWGASRLQDFFGMVDGPRVAEGRVAVTLHLLAPNQRAVQVTSDLAGFWAQHYPKLRTQLCRRYPKHAWPEDGRAARPPAPGKLR